MTISLSQLSADDSRLESYASRLHRSEVMEGGTSGVMEKAAIAQSEEKGDSLGDGRICEGRSTLIH